MKTTLNLWRLAALFLLLLGRLATAEAVQTVTVQVPLGGLQSVAELDDPANASVLTTLPTDAFVVGVAWNLSITALSPSWLSDVKFLVSGAATSPAVVIQPADGSDIAGSGLFSSGGMVDLVALGLGFEAAPGGVVTVQIYEVLDELIGGADATFAPGSYLTLQYQTQTVTAVPEPATVFLLLAGMAGLALWRRANPRAFATKA